MRAATAKVIALDEARIVREINDLQGIIKASCTNTLESAVRIGELLGQVKQSIGHGNFIPWVNTHCQFNRMTATTYIKCADAWKCITTGHLKDTEKPLTIAALAKLAPKNEKPKTVGILKAAGEILGGLPHGIDRWAIWQDEKTRTELREEFGGEYPSRVVHGSDEAKKFADAIQRLAAKRAAEKSQAETAVARTAVEQERAALSASAQAKFDRALRKATDLLRADFEREVRAEVERRIPLFKSAEERAEAKFLQYTELCKTVDEYMTRDEFRLVLGCLHPDRQPEPERPRYDKAFHIFKRLESKVDGSAVRRRERGW